MTENQPNTTKICPTCGTRLNINAARCSVCGANLAPNKAVSKDRPVQGARIPEVTLSLPLLIGLVLLLLAIGAGGIYAYQQYTPKKVAGVSTLAPGADTFTPTATSESTTTITPTPTNEVTDTPAPTWTLPPPVKYTVKSGDTCGSIAYVYKTSINNIITANKLDSNCTLIPGTELSIPLPTPTPSAQPSTTLNPTEQAIADCKKISYEVKSGDTLYGIAANYAVSKEAIKLYSGKTDEIVRAGETLIIPLCEQSLEAPTATPVPPYPAPNLLLPADGASFKSSDTITLQWASVGNLRQNEAYAVTIIDATEGNARKVVAYVTDTKYIVPQDLRPTGDVPHVFYWTILPVRQVGTNKDTGEAIWSPAGDVSQQRTFSWMGGPAPAPTDTPAK